MEAEPSAKFECLWLPLLICEIKFPFLIMDLFRRTEEYLSHFPTHPFFQYSLKNPVLFEESHSFKLPGLIIASASEEMIAVNLEDNLLKRQKCCSLAADKKGVPENQKYPNRR